MTCDHGFIGACADCDGSGQMPEDAQRWAEEALASHAAEGCTYCTFEVESPPGAPVICRACGSPLDERDTCTGCGVYHGEPCESCGERGYHLSTCPEMPDDAAYL